LPVWDRVRLTRPGHDVKLTTITETFTLQGKRQCLTNSQLKTAQAKPTSTMICEHGKKASSVVFVAMTWTIANCIADIVQTVTRLDA
jgi:hypothetical protein